ncbi:unnamed protein product [Closterium sp. NIES-54]
MLSQRSSSAFPQQGDLPARLQTLCLAPAVAATLWRRQQQRTGDGWAQPAGTRLGLRAGAGGAEGEAKRMAVVWAQQGTEGGAEGGNADVAFRELFEGPPARSRMDLPRGLAESWPDVTVSEGTSGGVGERESREGLEEITVNVPHCSEDATNGSVTPGTGFVHPGWKVSLRVPRHLKTLRHQDWTPPEACSTFRLFQSCLGALHPSPRVSKLLDGELGEEQEDEAEGAGSTVSLLSRLKSSTAVYLEANQVMPSGTCGGCPEDPLLNCTLRTLTWRYLRVPSNSSDVDFTVAAASATDAATVAGTFHPLRAPLLLPHTRKRISLGCRASPPLSASFSSAPSTRPLSTSSHRSSKSSEQHSEGEEENGREEQMESEVQREEGEGTGSGEQNEGEVGRESEQQSAGREKSEGEGGPAKAVRRRWVLEEGGDAEDAGSEGSVEAEDLQGEEREEETREEEQAGGEEMVGQVTKKEMGDSDSSSGGSHTSRRSRRGRKGRSSTSASSSGTGSPTTTATTGIGTGSTSSAAAADLTECQQLQLAELLLLSSARGLLYTRPSVEALFIAAQARARINQKAHTAAASPAADAAVASGDGETGGLLGEAGFSSAALSASSSFVVDPSVCEAPELAPFKNMWFLRQYLVDEELKTIYCFVPKAACTSWKVWFRQQHNLPNISDVYLAHDPKHSGLHVLASGYTESAVMSLLTRPDFFKFTFVRHPFARLASAYLNKHVNGGPPQGRAFWNKRFFHGTRPFQWLVDHQGGSDLLQFGDFVGLLRTMLKRRRRTMDPHVAPQVDVCRLNDIRFDFVGHFENLGEDVPVVMQRLNRTITSEAFSIGKSAHPTNARDKFLDLFDKCAMSAEGSEAAAAAEAAPESSSTPAPAADVDQLAGSFNGMTLDERYALVRSVGEECIQEDELRNLLLKKKDPVAYDGFEPSGRMHIAQGVMKALNVNKLTQSGCIFKFWVADWFAQLNNKMGGDLKKIQTVGRYMMEVWRAVGMDLTRVEFLWSSEEINGRAGEYWPLVMDIARKNKLPRILRCSQIMGRSETDELSAAQIFYPCMQCADIFFLKADICQLGMDQRKVNVLAREYCDDIKRKMKPIILSHHMLPGLLQGQEKMSKSDPNSAIFMEDEEAEVNVKIKKAFCPPGEVEANPCIAYVQYIVLPWFKQFEVERKEEHGGNVIYTDADQLCADYKEGKLHPGDLKLALSKAINKILQPVRDHFKTNPDAKKLLAQVKVSDRSFAVLNLLSPYLVASLSCRATRCHADAGTTLFV